MSDTGIDAARVALLREIAREGRVDAAPRRRRTARWIGGSALAGGLAATALVVGLVVVPATAPTASAVVFEKAAAGAEEAGSPRLAAGQYLRLRTDFAWRVVWDADMPDGAHFNNFDPDDAEAVLEVVDTGTTYVPADAGGDWVRERIPYVVTAAHGARAAEAKAEWEAQSPVEGLAGVTRYPGGVAEAGGDGGTFEYYLDDRELYADLPSDVPGTIEWFSRRYEGEGDANGLAHYFAETISDVAVFNLAPAAARASMLRAFATLDHVEVVATSGDRTTLRYERVRQDGDAAPIEFTLDTSRGYVLGVTSWPYGTDADPGPDAWTSRTTAEIAVVDSAP